MTTDTPASDGLVEQNDEEFLRDLAERIFHHATPQQGFDQGDVDRLYRIASEQTASAAMPTPDSALGDDLIGALAEGLWAQGRKRLGLTPEYLPRTRQDFRETAIQRLTALRSPADERAKVAYAAEPDTIAARERFEAELDRIQADRTDPSPDTPATEPSRDAGECRYEYWRTSQDVAAGKCFASTPCDQCSPPEPSDNSDGWQDIATHQSHAVVLVSRPATEREAFSATTAFLDVTNVWRVFRSEGGMTPLPFKPTHWMPLPPAPTDHSHPENSHEG